MLVENLFSRYLWRIEKNLAVKNINLILQFINIVINYLITISLFLNNLWSDRLPYNSLINKKIVIYTVKDFYLIAYILHAILFHIFINFILEFTRNFISWSIIFITIIFQDEFLHVLFCDLALVITIEYAGIWCDISCRRMELFVHWSV